MGAGAHESSLADRAQLFRRFDFTPVDAERPIKNTFCGLLIQSDMHMRITSRRIKS